MSALLEMRQVVHRFNGRTVLDIPSFTVQPDSITGLAGPNGSGKTTMLRLLSFVDPCTSGTIAFRGKPAAPFDNHIRYRISLLLQTPYLLKRSVFDNIAYGLRLRGSTDRLEKKVADALGLVGLHPSFSKRQWHELSGGESQRVALAARLALQPDCLLLDEPTASVDPQSAEMIRQALLVAKRKWHAGIVVSSHQHQWLQTFCDRIIDLHHGRIPAHSLQNILTGPWHYLGNGQATRTLSDQQTITLCPPPSPDANAVLPPGAITLLTYASERVQDNMLRGRIISIFSPEHAEDRFCLHILCAEQKFITELSLEQWRAMGLRPGQYVIVAFSSTEILWMSP